MHTSLTRRLGVLVGAGLAVLLVSPPVQAASPTETAPTSLDDVVTAKLLAQAEDRPGFGSADTSDTRVNVTRRDGGWAFGTAVLLAPKVEGAYPEGWLFLARREAGKWRVGFEGEPALADLASRAPVLKQRERRAFSAQDEVSPSYAGGDYRTGMALPWSVGQSWYMTSGPHGWGGYETPYSSLDLAGGDQVVRAARGGTAYTMCRGWVRVIHDRGYSTDHYHLWSNINVNGAGVGAGAYLGYTGTDVTCGGAASGRHVHFGLRQNGAYVPIGGHIIGKWTPYSSGSAYSGYALHGSRRVNAGGALYNYGALGFTQGIVDANGGTALNKRTGPGTGYAVAGSVADGATVSISCSRNGTSHTGRFGTTSMWNRLTDGTWVSDAFLATGVNGPVNGWC
ncbi:MAG: peptidase M23 [Micromonosporaceae bacterium]